MDFLSSELIIASIIELIKEHGMLAIILGVIIETIFAPIPSPLILMAAGAILIDPTSISTILLGAFFISIVAGITQTIASMILYAPGYFIGKPFITKFERFHGISWKEISDFENKFNKSNYEGITIFFLRALPIMPLSIISGVCGVIKINYKKYLLWTFLGTIPRNFILALSGFYFADFYFVFAKQLDSIESIVTLTIIIILIIFLIKKTKIIEKIRQRL